MSCLGGALAKQLFPAKMGALGPVGGGKQYQSWISLDDQIHAMHHLMLKKDCKGVYNLVAPNPTTQKEFAKTMGRIFIRPSVAPLPKFMVKILFGEKWERNCCWRVREYSQSVWLKAVMNSITHSPRRGIEAHDWQSKNVNQYPTLFLNLE